MKRFENKIALVTGGANGIGRATVERLVQEGAKVMIADYSLEEAQKLAEELNGRGHQAEAVFYDASDIEGGTRIVNETISRFGSIDVLVNNVGGSDLKRDLTLENLDMEYFEEVFRLNLKSMMATIRASLPEMKKKKQGSIVNVSSIGGVMGDFRGTLYGLSKAGVVNLTRYAATQLGEYGIRCNGVAPWLVLTPAAKRTLTEDLQKVYLKYNTVPYLGEAEDIAATIAFLASEDARYISGQTIIADGGMMCHNPTVKDMEAILK